MNFIKRIKPYLIVFLIGFITAMFIFLPYIIKDGGFFLISNDFDAQEIPINILANRSIKSGEIIWNWKIDLGSEFISAFGFYLLGSPFFYLSLLFKPEHFPYIVGWIFMLKYATATLTSYIYLERYLNRKIAIIAGLLYAFSGFQATNTVFYHFHDVVAFFPLLLIALDKLMLEKKKGLFLIACAINCFLNYYFFIGEAIFCIIYYLIRYNPIRNNIDKKDFFKGIYICLIEAIIGIGITGILLYPQLISVMNNPRTSNMMKLKNAFFFKPLDYFFYLRSLFIPADNMYEMPIIYTDNWTSFTLYMPMLSISLVLAYIFKKEKNWLKDILILCFILSLVPILNNIFVLFTSEVQHRWYFMFILMMVLASGKVIENYNEYKWKLFLLIDIIIVILIALIIRISPIDLFHFNRYLFLMFMGILGPIITYLLFMFKDKFKNYWYESFILLICIFSIITTLYVIRTYRRTYSSNTKMTMQEHFKDLMYSGGDLENVIPYRYSFWEHYANRSMVADISNRGSFLSTVSPSIIKMYKNLGEVRFSNASPNGPDGTNELFSVKYYVRLDKWDDILYTSYSNGNRDVYIYEADAVPIGFTYDNYLTISELLKIKRDYRGFAMFKSLIIEDDKVEEVSKVLRHYDEELDGAFVKDLVSSDLTKHKEESSKEFTYDTHGFKCIIEANNDTYAFFSVPYEKEWKALVNNEEREILDINGLMAVKIDKGKNSIEFEYQNTRIINGIIISILGILLALLYWIIIKNKDAFNKVLGRMKEMIKNNVVIKGISIFVIFLVIAITLNILAFTLPNDNIHKHVANASATFAYEGSFPDDFDDYKSSIYDNNTDAWMLLLAEYDGKEGLLEKAFMGYYSLYTLEPSELIGSMNIKFVKDGTRLATNMYPRYWHGWILPLRLLLQFFDYSDIRAMNYFILVIMIAIIITKLVKSNLTQVILPFMIGMLAIVPITSAMCMSYFECTFITLLFSIIILFKAQKIKDKIGFPLFFMIIGLCLGYFDFLTFPIITLGFPMFFLILLNEENNHELVSENLYLFLIKCSLMWLIGYAGIWASKWVVASLFTDYNVIQDAINQILYRTSNSSIVNDTKVNFLLAIIRNLVVYARKSYIILFIISAFLMLKKFNDDNKIINSKNKEYLIVLLLLTLYPFVWWSVTANHAYIHRHFTSKALALCIMSGLVLLKNVYNLIKNK